MNKCTNLKLVKKMASRLTYIIVAVLIIIILGSVGIWWFYTQGVEHKLVIIHPHSAALADTVIDDFADWAQETMGYSTYSKYHY